MYSWELDVPLSRFLELEVPDLLEEAQRLALSKKEPDAYGDLSQRLRDSIFFDVKTSEIVAAKAGWAVVKQLAAEKSLVVTRLVDRKGEMLYVPLGLLHAGRDEKALAGQLTIVQALPRERYVSASSCIRDWWYMLPEKLQGDSSDILKTVNRQKPASGWLRDIYVIVDDVRKQYLRYRAGEEPETGAGPEGLLAVAHQSRGAFWFDRKASKFLWGQIQRPYPPGSVAVLATCEAAGIDYENRRALDQLNGRGVDLIIAAPFQVRVGYGARLALKLDELIRKANLDPNPHRDRRLVTLFNQAADQVTAESTRQRYEDMRYEFLFLGDPELRLCLPE